MLKIILLLAGLMWLPAFAQNVGIGITTPIRARLELNGAVGNTNAIFGGEGQGVALIGSWPEVGYNIYYNDGYKRIGNGYAAVQLLDPNNGAMGIDMYGDGTKDVLTTGATRSLTILRSGNVGIRNEAGAATLWVARGDAGNDGTAVFSGTTYNSHFNYSTGENTYIRAGKVNGKVILNDIPGGQIVMGNGSGKVGINSGNPTYSLEILQSDHTGLLLIDPANYNNWELKTEAVGNSNYLFFRYNGTGTSFIEPDGSYHSGSDSRLKNNIHPLPGVLSKLLLLQPKEYKMKYNNPAGDKSIGFIAQDLQTQFPELVTVVDGEIMGHKEIPDLHTINYSGLSVIAVKAIQEQQEQIDAMKKEIEALKVLVKKRNQH